MEKRLNKSRIGDFSDRQNHILLNISRSWRVKSSGCAWYTSVLWGQSDHVKLSSRSFLKLRVAKKKRVSAVLVKRTLYLVWRDFTACDVELSAYPHSWTELRASMSSLSNYFLCALIVAQSSKVHCFITSSPSYPPNSGLNLTIFCSLPYHNVFLKPPSRGPFVSRSAHILRTSGFHSLPQRRPRRPILRPHPRRILPL